MFYEGVEFREIAGYKNYFISSCGIVLSIRRRFPKIISQVNHLGYLAVNIYNNSSKPKYLRVHRLVYECWVGCIPKGFVIDHKDGNKANNNLLNLEAVTPKENSIRAFNMGLMKTKPYAWFNEKNPNCKYSNEEVLKIRKLYKTGLYTQNQLGELFGMSQPTVSDITRKHTRGVQ